MEAISLSMAEVRKEHAALEELRVAENLRLHKMIEEYTAMEAQLESKDIALKAQTIALQAKVQEILALKAMDPSDRSKMEVEKLTKGSLQSSLPWGAIGQEICKPRRVSTTLNLVGGNIIVAMMQYGVNITNLERTKASKHSFRMATAPPRSHHLHDSISTDHPQSLESAHNATYFSHGWKLEGVVHST